MMKCQPIPFKIWLSLSVLASSSLPDNLSSSLLTSPALECFLLFPVLSCSPDLPFWVTFLTPPQAPAVSVRMLYRLRAEWEYMYGWVPSLFTWSYHSIVNWLLFSGSVMLDSLRPHGLQHTRLPCALPSLRACSNSCPLSQWRHSTISSSVVPFSSCLQSFPAPGSFLWVSFSASGGQSTGASPSASVLPMNIPDWFPLGWTGLISL